MEEVQAGAIPPERIRYRLTPLQRELPVLPAAGIILGTKVLFWQSGVPSGPPTFVVVLWLVIPFLALIPSPPGITLTPSAAVVRKVRSRTIPWSDVQAIQVESHLGARTIVIYEAGGRSTRLRAPITGFLTWDSRFEEKFHTIGRWWLEHRGSDWVPVPPPWAWWLCPQPHVPDGNPYASPE